MRGLRPWETSGGTCQAPHQEGYLWDLRKSVATSPRCSRFFGSVVFFAKPLSNMPVGVEYHCRSLFSTACHSPAWTCSSPPALILTVEVSTSRLIAFSHIAYIRVASQIYFKLGIKTYATAEIHSPERCISEIRSLLPRHDDKALYCEVYCSQRKYVCLATELLVLTTLPYRPCRAHGRSSRFG